MKKKIVALLFAVGMAVAGCGEAKTLGPVSFPVETSESISDTEEIPEMPEDSLEQEASASTTDGAENASVQTEVPDYNGQPYAELNGNVPLFSEEEKTTDPFETYSDLDSLGRCGVAYANICKEIMPTEKREGISEVHPSGWQSQKYDFIDGRWLYNRCHLIGFQLAGENANEKNLITGTRYLNIDGMLDHENQIADYVRETGNHVLYRVTPKFSGSNLVADGVCMEAYSVEDSGAGVCFYIFAYNVQPGVKINYADGTSTLDSDASAVSAETSSETFSEDTANTSEDAQDYILNTNSRKFHLPDCNGAKRTNAKNKQEVHAARQSLIDQGYEPCGMCNP